jgi:hypothetical protein
MFRAREASIIKEKYNFLGKSLKAEACPSYIKIKLYYNKIFFKYIKI